MYKTIEVQCNALTAQTSGSIEKNPKYRGSLINVTEMRAG